VYIALKRYLIKIVIIFLFSVFAAVQTFESNLYKKSVNRVFEKPPVPRLIGDLQFEIIKFLYK
jgi:hypothetical protein